TPNDIRGGLKWDIVLPLALLGLVLLTRHVLPVGESGRTPTLVAALTYIIPALALLNFSPRRMRFALGIAAFLLVPLAAEPGDTVATYRSFFGIYRVRAIENGDAHLLVNGTTLHGAESLLPGEENLPLT